MSGAGAVTARGRIDKRQAILDAAFTVFAREGYAQAGMDVIAAEAGAAKATVYSHFGDKENLLREAIAASADQALAENLAAVDRLTNRGDDLRATMESVGHRLLQCYCDDRSWALRRLLAAEIGQFPELLDIIHTRATDRITEALADRLARLTVTGHLHTPDPLLAAEQFFALLSGPIDKRARLGTRHVSDTELRAVARAAVHTFLQAFAAYPRAHGKSGLRRPVSRRSRLPPARGQGWHERARAALRPPVFPLRPVRGTRPRPLPRQADRGQWRPRRPAWPPRALAR